MINHISKGPRILLVESDFLVATDLMYELEQMGMVIANVSSSLAGTLTQIERGAFDFALVNIRLRDGDSYPAAKKLKLLNIPFAFFTGYNLAEIEPEFHDVPRIPKPQDAKAVARNVYNLIFAMPEKPDLYDEALS